MENENKESKEIKKVNNKTNLILPLVIVAVIMAGTALVVAMNQKVFSFNNTSKKNDVKEHSSKDISKNLGEEYTVTLDLRGGNIDSETPTTMKVVVGEKYGKIPTPTREGSKFVGWYLCDPACWGEEVTSDSMVETIGDHTLVARWKSNEYIVTFDAGEGKVSKKSIEVFADSTYGELPEAKLDGYTFVGWYLCEPACFGEEVTSTSTVTTYKDHKLVARYRKNDAETYTVTLDTRGGNTTVTSIKVVAGEKYGKLPEPTKTGATFVGWYFCDPACWGEEVTSDTLVTTLKDHTLVARWKSDEYTVILDAGEGDVPINKIKVFADSTYGDLPEATLPGATFVGWYLCEPACFGEEVTSTSKVTTYKDHRLVARFRIDEDQKYIVRFDYNGALPSTSNIEVVAGKKYGTLPTPTRPGAEFMGWYLCDPACWGEEVTSDTRVTLKKDHTLVARWKLTGEQTVTVTLDTNGGYVTTDTVIVAPGKTYGSLPSPTQPGYTFVGWYLCEPYCWGEEVTSTSKVTLTKDHKLVARWRKD